MASSPTSWASSSKPPSTNSSTSSDPHQGSTWDTRAHRGADALLVLCHAARDRAATDARGPRSHPDGWHPARTCKSRYPWTDRRASPGFAIPDAKLEQLRANTTIELVLVDADGAPVAIGRKYTALSPKITSAVLTRDGHCRWPGCDARIGLDIHHLVPRSWGGTDDISHLAAVCTLHHHHEQLIPHGPYALVGNPNLPDGLQLVVYADLTADQAQRYGLPPPPGHHRRPR